MKITSIFQAPRSVRGVREKQEGDGHARNPYQQRQQGKNREEERQEPRSEAEVQEAVAAFQVDAQAKANGLTAEVQGQGPGLRVTLKDGAGGIVRQFTGEEFLRLRQASTQDGKARGRILDQKL